MLRSRATEPLPASRHVRRQARTDRQRARSPVPISRRPLSRHRARTLSGAGEGRWLVLLVRVPEGAYPDALRPGRRRSCMTCGRPIYRLPQGHVTVVRNDIGDDGRHTPMTAGGADRMGSTLDGAPTLGWAVCPSGRYPTARGVRRCRSPTSPRTPTDFLTVPRPSGGSCHLTSHQWPAATPRTR